MANTQTTKTPFWRMNARKIGIIANVFMTLGYIAMLGLAITTINLFANWF